MSLNLTRRSVKGSPLSVTDHDTNLDKLEDGIEARLTQAQGNAAYATAAQGALASTAIQPGNPALSDAREWTAATIEQAEACVIEYVLCTKDVSTRCSRPCGRRPGRDPRVDKSVREPVFITALPPFAPS